VANDGTTKAGTCLRSLVRPGPARDRRRDQHRAEAHTIRLALIYALLDTARQIQPAHLTAALAL
jgi:hypothetical protein